MIDKKIIETTGAPAAIGPYSQAILVDGWLFLSGQIPINSATNQITGDDIIKQT
ncbi:MAG: Rid family hydrolase, partial [Planctomycetota bacterium]|nr:Rid family hydrolase [Planctomycetota bacterium]